ncbi:38986f43-27ee-48f9-aa6d-09813a10e16b [Sclerotinia trifoliorum]|uniref:38986f43-27ee-48f9-aa6d-09813a10e16b n=1 Tax=Sclerotinia trifoliorum TaxID=28548 RepID=A0A8H2VL24_9HELO|nr:38986f43-27ee-48f9-aa6d-09813a10e16b [Sclerotinia trifoliorum]
MRSLLKAFLLAPAIVSALVLPSSSEKDVDAEFKKNDINSADTYTMGFVRLNIGHGFQSADMSPLDLRIDILHSTDACGFGNVTIDGQALSQTFDPETLASSGKGSVSTSTNKIIVGSWSFDCIIIDGKPHGQFMKFMVDFVEGKAFENVGFSVLFRQTEKTEILNIETIPSKEDEFIEHHSRQGQSSDKKHHNGKGFEEHGHHMSHKDFNIHKELAELRYMKAQLEELKYLIHQKKRHISKHFQENHKLDRIRDCDSLRCVARVISDRARRFYERIAGYGRGEKHFHHSFKSQSERGTKHGKEFHGKLGNHNHTSGNHDFSAKSHGNNNHTDPHFPHHNRQNVLPVCHYPPPFGFHPHGRHHDRPHGRPHGPPHEFSHHRFDHERQSGIHHFQDEEGGGHWEGRPRYHGGHYGRPDEDDSEEVDRPHRDHDGSSHRQEDFDSETEGRHRKHAKPGHGQGPPSFNGPDSDRFQGHHHGEPPREGPLDGPEHERPHHPHERPLNGPEHDRPQDLQDEEPHYGPPQDAPHHKDFENQGPEVDRPQHESLEDQLAFHEPPSHDEPHPGPGSRFDGPPPPIMAESNEIPPGPGRPPKPPHFPLHILKLILIGFLLSLLIITLHRRTCNPTSHSDNHEKQHRRRNLTYRYTSKSQYASFKSWWLRITGGEESEEGDREALLEDYDSDVESTLTSTSTATSPSNISIADNTPNFQNPTQVAQEMVAVEDSHLLSPISSRSTPIPPQAQAPEYMNPISHLNGYTNHNQNQTQIQNEDILPPYEGPDHIQSHSYNHHYDYSYDYAGNEEDTLVADGFQYTPGSSAYNPSESGSDLNDVLGDKS